MEMTQDEEIEFHRLKTARDSLLLTVANLRGQLETIAAEEREACAKLCETISNTQANMNAAWRNGCRDAATEIRARGQP